MIRTLTAAAGLALMTVPTMVAAQQAGNRAGSTAAPAAVRAMEPRIVALFEAYMRQANVPGVAWGLVVDGRPVLLKGAGIADVPARRAVTADTRFRIASMSKAFTALAILKLRDEGRVVLDAPAETYVPELRDWRYPTADSPKITVRDLLHHTAGLVEDNPWGDRMQPISPADFTTMLRGPVPFANAPGVTMEYSNLGYATLGRIVTNAGGTRYQDWIGANLLTPLGMRATGYDAPAGAQAMRALPYRWQDDAWVREPDMADGEFGAMGGMDTTANDYWRWVAFLLSAWPARDGADAGPVKRSTVREIVEGLNFPSARMRPPLTDGGAPCRQASAYGMGWQVIDDCDLGRVVTHTGGYPGYGSVVVLLPDAGIGMFAFANRTYAAPVMPTMQALAAMRAAGLAPDRAKPVSADLARVYARAKDAWTSGDPARAPLAVNVPLDRDLARRRADIAALKAEVGACRTDAPITPISAMEGTFLWTCANGRVAGRVQRAPTPELSLQVLSFRRAQ